MSGSPRHTPSIPSLLSLAALSLPAVGLGCSRADSAATVIDDSLYVEIMTRLVVVRDSMDDIRLPYWSQRQALDSVEAAVEADYGVTADDLFRFARATGRDPARMRRLWETIGERVDSLRPSEEPAVDETADEEPRGGALRRRAGAERTRP